LSKGCFGGLRIRNLDRLGGRRAMVIESSLGLLVLMTSSPQAFLLCGPSERIAELNLRRDSHSHGGLGNDVPLCGVYLGHC